MENEEQTTKEHITSEVIEKETSEEGTQESLETKPERKTLEEMEKEELVKTARGLYSRLKKEKAARTEVEDIIDTAAKELEASGEFTEEEKKELGKEVAGKEDVFGLMRTVSALKDYSSDPAELDYIALISKAKGIPPEEAVQTPEVSLWIQAHREKVAKESKVPLSSSPSSAVPIFDAEKMVREGRDVEEAKKRGEELERKEKGGGI